ncbi:MAG TPA: hypothetical protein VN429_06650 [Methanospirillum sp.]|uniref:hypothetical protein n=1 Tax=Methanospirillum sp. TaxID=45200 RepID=UPI002D0769A7|nr:hypothetical protein [Methanospirillum sp.]HWQ64079.1 hypothetical protein [Methanospirillum sp.]
MKGEYLAIALICLVISGLAGADYLATTISTDGSVMLASAGSDENGSFASRVMASDKAEVHRSVSGSDETESDLIVRSAGPMLFSDFASAIWKGSDLNRVCALLRSPDDLNDGKVSVYSSGIIKGEVDTVRQVGNGLSGQTSANGTGLLVLGSQSESNRSLGSRGFVSGNMSVQDMIRYGGRL